MGESGGAVATRRSGLMSPSARATEVIDVGVFAILGVGGNRVKPGDFTRHGEVAARRGRRWRDDGSF